MGTRLADPPENVPLQVYGRQAGESAVVGAGEVETLGDEDLRLAVAVEVAEAKVTVGAKAGGRDLFPEHRLGQRIAQRALLRSPAVKVCLRRSLRLAAGSQPEGGKVSGHLRPEAHLAQRILALLRLQHDLAIHTHHDPRPDAFHTHLVITIHIERIATGGQQPLRAMMAIEQGDHASRETHGEVAAAILIAHDQPTSPLKAQGPDFSLEGVIPPEALTRDEHRRPGQRLLPMRHDASAPFFQHPPVATRPRRPGMVDGSERPAAHGAIHDVVLPLGSGGPFRGSTKLQAGEILLEQDDLIQAH